MLGTRVLGAVLTAGRVKVTVAIMQGHAWVMGSATLAVSVRNSLAVPQEA